MLRSMIWFLISGVITIGLLFGGLVLIAFLKSRGDETWGLWLIGYLAVYYLVAFSLLSRVGGR